MADKKDQNGISAAFEAEVTLSEGPGALSAHFKLRGTVLSILLPRGEDGGAAGLYRLNLDKQDALLAALTSLPTTVAGPPPSPDMPVASFAIRAHGKEQRLVALRPTSDPHVDKILNELGRCEQAVKDKPILAISLAVQSVVPAKPGAPQTVTVRVSAKGERGAEVAFNPGLVLLQAASEPKPAPPGVTPLPPEWDQVSAPSVGSPGSPVPHLKAGATLDVKLTVNVPASEPRRLRAIFNGNASFQVPDHVEDVRLSLGSRVVPLSATPH